MVSQMVASSYAGVGFDDFELTEGGAAYLILDKETE